MDCKDKFERWGWIIISLIAIVAMFYSTLEYAREITEMNEKGMRKSYYDE